ncbi:MAG: glycerophosphodiester phosphodiesterase [Burkholderiales bacterium]
MSATSLAFDLQGHRGARGLLPENSIAGFVKALAIGVTTLELDVAITKDGVVVISHDPSLNPDITRSGKGKWIEPPYPPIASVFYADLARYDVGKMRPGSNYAQRFPFQKGRARMRIPRLIDLFDTARSLDATAIRFNIETKTFPDSPELTLPPDVFARALIAEIRRANVATRTTVQSFDWRTLAVVQREAPEIPTVYLTAQQEWLDNIWADRETPSPWTIDVRFAVEGSVPRMVQAAGGKIWSPFFGDVTRSNLGEAKALGMRVIAWTVNTRPDMERLIDWGVDGLISDYPDLLRTVAIEKGLPVPAPVRARRRTKTDQ